MFSIPFRIGYRGRSRPEDNSDEEEFSIAPASPAIEATRDTSRNGMEERRIMWDAFQTPTKYAVLNSGAGAVLERIRDLLNETERADIDYGNAWGRPKDPIVFVPVYVRDTASGKNIGAIDVRVDRRRRKVEECSMDALERQIEGFRASVRATFASKVCSVEDSAER